LDNKWRHVSIVYDAATSTMTLFLDGVANPNKKTWGTHGNINIDNNTIVEMRVGAGPGDNIDSDDWLSSSWKGGIDQLRMYSKALTAAEIQTLFNSKQ
jgi:Concanavalin A-like lectin/glucanases superfamily